MATSDSTGSNVIPIKPARKVRARKPFAFPKQIADVLHDNQARIYEALAVAKLLAAHAMEAPAELVDCDHVDITIRGTDAIVRLLTPVGGLDDPQDLVMQGKERGLIPREEAANG